MSLRIETTVRGQFTKLRVLSILEKSCGFNSRYTKYILNIHDNFTVAFLKSNNTVGHVPASGYILQKSGSERTCIISGGSVHLHLQTPFAQQS